MQQMKLGRHLNTRWAISFLRRVEELSLWLGLGPFFQAWRECCMMLLQAEAGLAAEAFTVLMQHCGPQQTLWADVPPQPSAGYTARRNDQHHTHTAASKRPKQPSIDCLAAWLLDRTCATGNYDASFSGW